MSVYHLNSILQENLNPLSAGPVYIQECHSVCVDASHIFTGMDMTKYISKLIKYCPL